MLLKMGPVYICYNIHFFPHQTLAHCAHGKASSKGSGPHVVQHSRMQLGEEKLGNTFPGIHRISIHAQDFFILRQSKSLEARKMKWVDEGEKTSNRP